MDQSAALKRVLPADAGAVHSSPKKPRTVEAVAVVAAATVRHGPLENEGGVSDAVLKGDEPHTPIAEVSTGVNHIKLDGEQGADLTEPDRVKPEADGAETKKVKKRGKAAVNGKTKAPAKTKAKAKAKAKPRAKTVPKRKGRTEEDKVRENAPLAKPFFVETGAEWNNTNIDFDELAALRSQWELPAACHILWLLQTPLTLRFSNTLLEYEAALLKPEDSPVLEDVFTKLLLKKSERACLSAGIGLKYEWWNKQLRIYYMDMYDKWYALLRKAGERLPETFSQDEDDDDDDVSNESGSDSKAEEQVDVELTDDEWLTLDILKARLETLGMVCPLKHQSYADLSIELRCKILLNLCEAVVDDPANTEYMRQMEDDDLRVEPVGNDRAGNLFYFFPQFYEERRLYRLDTITQEWSLWAKGDEAFRSMLAAMKKIKGRKIRGEQELLDHLEVIVEQISDEDEARQRQLEKANRLAILEAIPRKRSLRLQVKQLEKMEKHQEELEHQKELSMEEIADMQRAELLRKAEKEAEKEARDAEREARRLHREQVERDEQLVEREQRRLRRIEKEKEMERLEKLQEEERKKQEEARELRARQRHAAEQEEQEAVDATIAATKGQEPDAASATP